MPRNGSNSGKNSGGGSNSRGSRRPRDDEGRFTSQSWTSTARENPYATAALAAGVAAASAFLWSRRGQVSDYAQSGVERLNELKDDYLSGDDQRSQSEIAEEALTLKETGGSKSSGPKGPIAQQDIKAGMAV